MSNIDTLRAEKKRACPVFVAALTTKGIQLNDFCKLDITCSEHPLLSPANHLWLVWNHIHCNSKSSKSRPFNEHGKKYLAAIALPLNIYIYSCYYLGMLTHTHRETSHVKVVCKVVLWNIIELERKLTMFPQYTELCVYYHLWQDISYSVILIQNLCITCRDKHKQSLELSMETARQARMLNKTMLVPFWKSATQLPRWGKLADVGWQRRKTWP